MKSDPTAGIDSRLSHLEADTTPWSDARQCAGNARAALADHAADRRTAPRDPATAFDSRRVAGARSLLLCKRAWPLTSAWHSPQTKATRPRADNPGPAGALGFVDKQHWRPTLLSLVHLDSLGIDHRDARSGGNAAVARERHRPIDAVPFVVKAPARFEPALNARATVGVTSTSAPTAPLRAGPPDGRLVPPRGGVESTALLAYGRG
jgi:hypothetical protein